MNVRGVIKLDLSAYEVGNCQFLSAEAVDQAYRVLSGIPDHSIVSIDIGNANGFDPRLLHYLAEMLTTADTVQIAGSDHRGVETLVAHLRSAVIA